MSSRSAPPPKPQNPKKRTGRVFFRIGQEKCVINLGRQVNQKQRRSFLTHLNRLIGAKSAGTKPDKGDLEWLGGLADAVHAQIEARGLCNPRIKPEVFADYLENYFESRAQVAVSTKERWSTAIGHARQFFGTKTLQALTREDAQGFRSWLLKKKGQTKETMSEATVRKTCSILSGAVVEAVKRGLLSSNAFEAVPKSNMASPDSEAVVPATEVMKVIAYASHPEDKILLGLARFAGLRIPSEIDRLLWGDVNLAEGLLTVYAKKTERYGKTRRVIPIEPRLREILNSCKPADAPDEDHVLPYLRTHSALGVRFRRLCKAAGVKPWDKCFTNLRKSFASDMCIGRSPSDVAAWLGNTTPVFVKHYLRQQGEGYTRKVAAEFAARAGGGNSGGTPRQNGSFGVVATAVASAAATNRHGRSDGVQTPNRSLVVSGSDASCLPVKGCDGQAQSEGSGRWGARTLDLTGVIRAL
jgi:integrase